MSWRPQRWLSDIGDRINCTPPSNRSVNTGALCLWTAQKIHESAYDKQKMASAVANLHSGNNARFNAEVLSWDSRPFVHEASAGAAKAIRSRLDAQETPQDGYQVLEIGCGTGILSFLLAKDERIKRIVAVDAAEGMINVLKTKIAKDQEVGHKLFPLAILLEDPEDPALPPAESGQGTQKFDLITSHLVLHHIPDLKSVLETMYRCLAPGGSVMLTDFENVSDESRRFHPAAKMDGVARHGINASEMTDLMKDVGFLDVDVKAHWIMDKTVEKYPGEFEKEHGAKTAREFSDLGETMKFPFVLCYGVKG